MYKVIYSILLPLLFVSNIVIAQTKKNINWEKLDEGLSLCEYISPKKSTLGNHTLTVLKVNPKFYDFKLFSAKQKGEQTRTAEGWAKHKKLIAVINAGMYRMDHATNLGYMKNYNFLNNSKLNKDNTIVAFNRKDNSVPEFQIIDKSCQNWDILKNKYHSYSQSIRMIDCKQNNKWSKQNKKWSMVAIGKDKKGNALFIISRSPYTVHDFINIVLNGPFDIYNLMYLEGGPEASFYLKHPKKQISVVGSYETGFNENDKNISFWNIPNIIGIVKK